MSAAHPADRTPTDVLRSLKRYAAIALGDAWEVRLVDEEGAFRRPFAQVTFTGPVAYTGPSTYRDAMQTFVIAAYPRPGTLMEDSLLNALAAQDALDTAFMQGIDEGRPMRVPLYDYYGVSLRDAATVRYPRSYMRLDDYTSQVNQDTEDPKLLILHADLRVAWRRVGALSSRDRMVERVIIKEQSLGGK